MSNKLPSPPPDQAPAAETVEDAAAQLLIELAWLVPPGTDMGPSSPIGKRLIAFKEALLRAVPLAPPVEAEEHDPLCSLGQRAGDQTMPCDCDGPAAVPLAPQAPEWIRCEGCTRGYLAFRGGGHGMDRDWHRFPDGTEQPCTTPEDAKQVSHAMHANMVRLVEAAFTKEEWAAASDEMHDSGNSSWCGVVRIAVRNLREAVPPAPEPSDYKALYFELLYEVATKHPDESRHETARRYIREREQPKNQQVCSALPAPPEGSAP